jgi:hypothetical protein
MVAAEVAAAISGLRRGTPGWRIAEVLEQRPAAHGNSRALTGDALISRTSSRTLALDEPDRLALRGRPETHRRAPEL